MVADKVAAGIGGALVAVGNGAGWRNPGKRKKNGLLAIFFAGFSGENPRAFMQTIDAPSMALFGCEKKIARCLLF